MISMAEGSSTKFSKNIRKFAQNVELELGVVLRKISLDALNGVMKRTPVDTGRLRASWRIGVNAVDPSTAPESDASAGTAGVGATGTELSAALGALAKAKAGDTVHISNSVEYAQYVEEDARMLQDTVQELEAILASAVRGKRK